MIAPTILLVLASLASDPATGVETSTWQAQGALPFEQLGSAVDVDNALAAVGAPSAVGNFDSGAGRVYLYRPHAGGSWRHVATLAPADGANGDRFGASVAVVWSSPQIVVVGAPDADAHGEGAPRGAVYVFRNVAAGGDQWVQDAKLAPSDLDPGADFGASVAAAGLASAHRIAVGAPLDNPCDTLFPCGSLYVYDYASGGAALDAKIAPAAGTTFYGTAVATAGSYVAVGTQGGGAWVLHDGGGGWGSVASIVPSDAPVGGFGSALSMTSTFLAVGARGHDGDGNDAGAAYVFERVGANSWQERVRYLGAQPGGRLGETIDLSRKTGSDHHLLVGAPQAGEVHEAAWTGTWGPLATIAPFDGAVDVGFGEAVATGIYPAWFVGAPFDDDAESLGGALYVGDTATLQLVEAKHLPTLRHAGTGLGARLAADRDRAVVAAPGSSEAGASSGSVFVWERNGSAWAQTARLWAQDQAGRLAGFGTAVDLDGDTIAVGAPGEGVAGAAAPFAGAVYVFRGAGTSWSREARLADAGNFDELGSAVAVDGDRLAAGAPGDGAGVVRTYERSGTAWSAGPVLQPVGGGATDAFGAAVALSGDVLVAGAPEESLTLSDAGAVHVFVRAGTTWSHAAKLVSPFPEAGARFGACVATDGERVVVGAPGQDSFGVSDAGAVVVFRRGGPTTWALEALSLPHFADPGDAYGSSVALRGNEIAVGVPGDDAGAGSVRLLRWKGTIWNQDVHVPPDDRQAGDARGCAVAFAGATVLAGARGRDTGPLEDVGAFHAFEIPRGVQLYCAGKTNSLGCVPFLNVFGTPSATSWPFELSARDCIAGEPGFLLYGFSKANLGFHGGTLCVKAPFQRLLPPKAATALGTPPCDGVVSRDFSKRIQSGNDPLLTVGQTVFAQWRLRDPADPAGFGDGLTDAVRFTVCP